MPGVKLFIFSYNFVVSDYVFVFFLWSGLLKMFYRHLNDHAIGIVVKPSRNPKGRSPNEPIA